jgi:hypothetical protein
VSSTRRLLRWCGTGDEASPGRSSESYLAVVIPRCFPDRSVLFVDIGGVGLDRYFIPLLNFRVIAGRGQVLLQDVRLGGVVG